MRQIIENNDIEERIIRNAEEESKVVPVRNFHGRRGWWTNNNQLGIKLPFQPPVGSEKTPMSVLRLDEAGLPRVWTLALGVGLIGDVVDGGFDCLALIDFGAGGVTQTVEVDWMVGTVISMPMNALDVRAKWVPREGDEDLFPAETIFVCAQLSRGALARSIATRSFHFTVPEATQSEGFDPGETDIIRVPPFARSVTFIPQTLSDVPRVFSPTTVFEYLGNVNGSQVGTISGDFMGPNVRFPVALFSRYFRIRNYIVDQAVGMTVQFNLFDT